MNIKDMLGKKGTVKIVLKYSNNDKHSVNINGKYETLYTPFVIATTTIIPNTNNKNIKVTNGKVITNGTSSVIAAITTPGLYESLKIDKLKGMDTIELSYDTDSFELNAIYSVATPKLIDSSDLEIFDNIDKLYSSINTLTNSSNQLKSGSNKLLQGASQINDGVSQLKDGINSAYNGSKTIENILNNSIYSLQNDNEEAIDSNTLAYIKNQASTGATQTIEKMFTDEYKQAIGNQAIEALKTNSEYNSLKENINKLAPLYNICTQEEVPEQYQETCLNMQSEIASYPTLVKVVSAMEKTARETAIQTAYQTAIQTSKQTAETVSENVAKQVANNAKETAKKQTSESLTKLLGGIVQLTDGLNTINSKMTDLTNGTEELRNGIAQLDSGLAQFNSQGINKIANIVNGDVKSIEGRVKALISLSSNYKTFDDSTKETTGSTKIIMIVDGIKQENKTVFNNKQIIEDKESLWDKAKKNRKNKESQN